MENRTDKYIDALALAVIILALIAIIITIAFAIIALCLTATGQITVTSAESHAAIAQCTLNAARNLVRSFPGRI